jgi:hypothetical protein
MLGYTLRRFTLLVAGASLGAWLCLRAQFGFALSPQPAEEVLLVGVVLASALVLVAFVLLPLSSLVERLASSRAVTASVLVVSVMASLAVGLWVYTGFLHRPIDLVLQRDWPYLLSFSLVGLGYALAYVLARRI